MIDAVSNSFRLGIQIAAPVLVFSLIFNIALGLISRLIPQVQVFMTGLPLSIILSLAVIALGLGGGLLMWLEAMETQIRVFTRVPTPGGVALAGIAGLAVLRRRRVA